MKTKIKTTYRIFNLGEIIKEKCSPVTSIAKATGIDQSTIHRYKRGETLLEENFDKLYEYFGDKLKYEKIQKKIKLISEKQKHYNHELAPTPENIRKKLAEIRAKQGRNPDGSKIGKTDRMKEIEAEVKYENEKTDRIEALYKSQGINLKTINKGFKDISCACNLGKQI